jgi:hypothetical protein
MSRRATMITVSPEKNNKKHIRLTLNFEISIDPSAIPNQGTDEEEIAYYARQRRLLHEILSNKEDLHRFLIGQIHTEFETGGMKNEIFEEEEVDIDMSLAPPIARLSKTDQEYYREVEAENIFFEQVEGVFDCFSTAISAVEIAICECEVEG